MTDPGPAHILLLYSDQNDLLRRIRPYILEAVKRKMFVNILAAEPKQAEAVLPKGSRSSFLIQDARAMLPFGSRPMHGFLRVYEEARERCRAGDFQGWTWVGIWQHLIYDNFDVCFDFERYINAHPPSTTICAMRNEGFCSLPVSLSLELFVLHTKSIFRTAVF